eukprot:782931_1
MVYGQGHRQGHQEAHRQVGGSNTRGRRGYTRRGRGIGIGKDIKRNIGKLTAAAAKERVASTIAKNAAAIASADCECGLRVRVASCAYGLRMDRSKTTPDRRNNCTVFLSPSSEN